VIDENTGIPFTWGRKNTRDEVEANKIMFNMIDKFEDGNVEGKVKSKKRNNRKKYRPFPLTTVKFQKLATDKLRMSSAEAM
jgi:DNA topoisomerase IA